MESLSWLFKLVDQVTGPAAKMAKSLKGFAGGIKHAAVGVKDAGKGLVEWGSKLNGALEVVGKVANGFIALGRSALDFGKYLVHASEFKKSTFAGLDALEGSARMAEAARKTLELMAKNSGQDVGALVGKFKELRLQGFATQDAFDAIAASLSVAAANGDKAGDATLDLLKSVKGNDKGLFDKSALDGITKIGVPVDHFKKQLAKLKGVTVDEIEGMVKAGKVTADEGVAAILQTIGDRFDKGQGLGSLAKQLSGDSVTGQLQVFQNTLLAIFGDTKITEPLVRALKAINALFDENTATGKKLREFLQRTFEKLGTIIDSIASSDLASVFDGALGFFDAIDTVISHVWPYLEAMGGPLWEGLKSAVKPLIGMWHKIFPDKGGGTDSRLVDVLKTLGTVLGWVLGIIIDLAAWVVMSTLAAGALAWVIIGAVCKAFGALIDGAVDVWNAVVDFVDGIVDAASSLWDSAISIASDFIDGLIQGISDGWDSVIKTVTGLADAVVGTIKKKLGIASPSKVMASFGAFTAIGFAQGVESKSDMAEGALGAMVTPASLGSGTAGAAASPSGASGAGSVSIGDIIVNVPEGTKEPQAFGRAVGDEVRARVLALFEELGLQIGSVAA